MSRKFFCYVDETGQDTNGRLFIVAVVVTAENRDELRQTCELIEQISHKGQRKWAKSSKSARVSYIQQLLAQRIISDFQASYAIYSNNHDYVDLTVRTIARTIEASHETEYEATVLIDGLPRSMERRVGLHLRRLGIHVKKVRGIDDEADVLIRLADAICGLVRGAEEGESVFKELLAQGTQVQVLYDLSP
ncbi:MAG: DUF3800 domain-containing protein [Caldilineales bacterium]|nr:DUF3800 domain-containing protein [Caldilineales bacterium]MCW5860405.1 DUF3800 domain-containing protein [Caldilineales bacterium]